MTPKIRPAFDYDDENPDEYYDTDTTATSDPPDTALHGQAED